MTVSTARQHSILTEQQMVNGRPAFMISLALAPTAFGRLSGQFGVHCTLNTGAQMLR
jgi:hypothetical protein